jgi:putative endonuclease
MNYTVYILYSSSLDKFYVGYTGDLIEERLRRHNSNHKGFTGGKADWVVRYTEMYNDKSFALKREKEIKSKKSRKYIESLITQLG